MKLMTKALEKRFKQVGRQEEVKDPLVIAKYFYPASAATWYATEYDPDTNICFGYVTGLQKDEWGYFSLTELSEVVVHGIKIERDLWFEEQPFSKLEV